MLSINKSAIKINNKQVLFFLLKLNAKCKLLGASLGYMVDIHTMNHFTDVLLHTTLVIKHNHKGNHHVHQSRRR
jgi:hypothetical protein